MERLGAKGLRAPEEAVGKAFDLAHAELLAAERLDERVDVLGTDAR